MSPSRRSGILLHPTSLPSRWGVGDLGPEAYAFVDFLAETGQTLWQILPLGPTGYGNSPYMCFSAFGGNPLLISPDELLKQRLLESADIAPLPAFPAQAVDYGRVVAHKTGLLKKAYRRFRAGGDRRDFFDFIERNAAWLEDYALFMALKASHDGRVWTRWDDGAATRKPSALARWRTELAAEIEFRKFTQYAFFTQWQALKQYCHARGVQVIGDVPIYVAHDSAEVWANRELFVLDEETGEPLVVAGVPPDYFSATGQRWGNPLYRWALMASRGYRWWVERFRTNFELVDVVRLDHFRGFQAYWEIAATEPTAMNGRWVRGPGAAVFEAVRNALGHFEAIAEDLGVITPDVDALRDHLGLPGMRILQMAFGDDAKAMEYRPHRHVRNCVAYTATHDHNTTVGWFTAAPGTQTTQATEQVERERRNALRYLGRDGSEIHWAMIRLALSSPADTAIFPLQDVLGLGTEARMNRPGTLKGNWEWRFTHDMLTAQVRDRLRDLTETYERSPTMKLHR